MALCFSAVTINPREVTILVFYGKLHVFLLTLLILEIEFSLITKFLVFFFTGKTR